MLEFLKEFSKYYGRRETLGGTFEATPVGFVMIFFLIPFYKKLLKF